MLKKKIKIELNSIFFLRIFSVASFCLLVACTADMKSVEPSINPNPKEIYDITVTVEGAPGEFLSAEGVHRYAVADETCLPLTSFSGVPAVTYARYEKVKYKRTTPTTFTARVVLDKFMPKDDYGLGLCKWTSNVLSAKLNNDVNQHLISFSPLSESRIKFAYQLVFFHLDRPASEPSNVGLSGDIVNESNAAKFSHEKYYYISMIAKRADL